MTRWKTLGALALVIAGTTRSSSQVRTDLPQNLPGYPTIAQVRVVNAARDEAVPVVIRADADPVPVTVIGAPSVALLPTTVVATRSARQAWEYRQMVIAGGQDAAAALNAAGADGWEAVAGLGGVDGTVWTLKRPR